MASPAPSDHASQLAALIAAQQSDAKCYRCLGTHESDLAPADDPGLHVLDTLTDPRQAEPSAIAEAVELQELADPTAGARRRANAALGLQLMGLNTVWNQEQTRFDPKQSACPTCGGEKLPRNAHCLICSASASDPRQWPMVTKLALEPPKKRPRPRIAPKGKGKARTASAPKGEPGELLGGLSGKR